MIYESNESPSWVGMSILVSGPTHHCHKHGDIDTTMRVHIDPDNDRVFCMHCVADILEEKIGTVTEIKDSPDETA